MAERLRNSYDFRFHLHEAQTGAAVEFKSSEPRGHPRRAVYGGYGRRTACRLDALFGVRVGGWPFVVALLLYYIIYFVEAGISWVYNTVRRKLSATAAADTAYYASMFEMEAHANEGDNQYIRGRKSFNWIRYFGKV